MRRETIWEGMETIRPNVTIIRIQNTYSYCLTVVQVGNKHSGWFETKRGVRKGSVVSPVLLSVVMDETVEIVRAQVRDM
jgi:hypothetical protein